MKQLKDILLERLVLSKTKSSSLPHWEDFIKALRNFNDNNKIGHLDPSFTATAILDMGKYKPKFLDDDGNPSNIYIDDISVVGEKSIKLSTDNDRKSITFRMPEDFEDFIVCLGTGDKETGEKLYTGLYSEIE